MKLHTLNYGPIDIHVHVDWQAHKKYISHQRSSKLHKGKKEVHKKPD